VIDNRNLILAVVLSVVILFAFEYLIGGPQRERLAEQQAAQQTAPTAEHGEIPLPGATTEPLPPGAEIGATSEVSAAMSREAALEQSPRVRIETPVLSGSIALRGAQLDDLILTRYHEAIAEDSPEIDLLSPLDMAQPYYAYFRWSSGDRTLELPDGQTLWQADNQTLTPERPVTLTWTNSQGVRFEQVVALDEGYMFTVTQRVVNEGSATVALSPFGLISRTGHPDVLGFYILHEGLIGVFDETLEEKDYDELEESGTIQHSTTGGWLGITDKYWLVALIPDQQKTVGTRFVHTAGANLGKYQSDFLYDVVSVPPGKSLETTSRLFAGAKEVSRLDAYQEELGIVRFDRAVDFGWFYFLTKPFFYMLHYFAGILGNFGLSILLVTVLVKLLFFPLANKSYRAMAKMKKLQPSGCLPIVIQIPVFFALYKVLFVSIEMRHTPFYGWIHDLSAPDPTSVLNLFGLLPWEVGDIGLLAILNIGVWPIAMGLTMVLQHRLNPQPTDPVQAKVFLMMPIVFTFLLAKFPAGLVIYWTWNNLLSIIQQMVIMKRAGVPIGRKGGGQPAHTRRPEPEKDADTSKRQDRPEVDNDGDTSQDQPESAPRKDGKASKRRRRSKAKKDGKASKGQRRSEAETDLR
jgi:YidC/Oxa1 family membrane protein insertase